MRAVIVEIRGNTVAMLSDEGCIVKMKNKNYEIGQELTIHMKKKSSTKNLYIYAAAAACLLVMFGGGSFAYYTPSTYVTLDVNPSIEYSVNMFNRVLTAKGINDDGTQIINEIELKNFKNKTIDKAIALTVDQIAESGYLDGNESGIVITTSAKDMKKATKLAQNLEDIADEATEENNFEAVVTAEAVGAERVSQAKELGVSPGKLNLVEKLIDSSETPENIDQNEWLHKSVKEIMAQTNQNKAQTRDENKEQKQTNKQTQKNDLEEASDLETNEDLDTTEELEKVEELDTAEQLENAKELDTAEQLENMDELNQSEGKNQSETSEKKSQDSKVQDQGKNKKIKSN